MKRTITLLLSLLLIASLMVACGKKPLKALPAPDALAASLLDGGVFSDELEPADADIGAFLYGLTDAEGAEMFFWLSSGATAEEISIFRCENAAVLEVVRAAVDVRLDFQKSTYQDYAPGEVPKLENAQVRVRDNTLLVCVSADAQKAAALLDPYFPA
jgi:hypothetical protein